MLSAYIKSCGLVAPGLPNYNDAIPALRAEQVFSYAAIDKYAPERLPRNERRRCTRLTRLAFNAADQAISGVADPQTLQNVFASATGDTDIVDSVSRTLAGSESPQLSPTQFHNSVHNSSVGYWSIATEAKGYSTAISAFDDSAVAGLTEALLLLQDKPQHDVLLLCYDIKPPQPLAAKRDIQEDMALALLISSQADNSTAKISISPSDEALSSCISGVEALRLANPAGRLLPLVEALALQKNQTLVIGQTQRLQVELTALL